jgi:hypothetical protein
MTRKAALFFALILLILTVPSCSASPYPSCRSILTSMAGAEAQLPAGRFCCFDAEQGEKEYLSPTLLSAWLGTPAPSEGWLDCALYLSLREKPCELAAVLCESRDAAEDTAKLFSARWHTILAETAANVYIQDLCDLVAMREGLTGYQFYPLYVMDVATIGWE